MNGKGDRNRSNRADYNKSFNRIFGEDMSEPTFRLRPSASSRWLACPASELLAELAEKVPTVAESRAAAEGTVCHQVLEHRISSELDDYKLGDIITVQSDDMVFPMTFNVDEQMLAAVDFFLGHINLTNPHHTELTHRHSKVEELEGTADYFELTSPEHGELFDLKYGKSTVIAKSRAGTVNTQLMSYISLMFDRFPELKTIEAHLIQPRCKSIAKVRSTGVITRDESDVFMMRVMSVAAQVGAMKAMDSVDTGLLCEGSHCWWCPAKDICPVKKLSSINRDFKS